MSVSPQHTYSISPNHCEFLSMWPALWRCETCGGSKTSWQPNIIHFFSCFSQQKGILWKYQENVDLEKGQGREKVKGNFLQWAEASFSSTIKSLVVAWHCKVYRALAGFVYLLVKVASQHIPIFPLWENFSVKNSCKYEQRSVLFL